MTTTTDDRPRLILASGSPRRRELLRGLGLEFTVRPVDLDETRRPDEDPRSYVLRLAEEKAAHEQSPGELILAADTIVVLDGDVLGKPTDEADARRMLARLAGRRHVVLTGVSALDGLTGERVMDVERSEVEIAPLTDDWIAWYVATGEPMDKAGSYAIQDLGALFVESVTGNYTNVVGLPLPLTGRLVGRLGWDLRGFRSS